jgi:PAS domain S-box-containing protein
MTEKNTQGELSGNKVTQNWTTGLPDDEIARYWLAAIIESAEDGIISKTLDGIITSWNKGAERIFGYTADEVIGKPITILIPPDHHNEEPEILRKIRKGERIEHYESVRVRKDGSLINISLTISPIKDASGKIIGASKIVRDISERKQTESKLQEALEKAQKAQAEAEEANRLKDEFLATVSHELRTPLTSVMGWARMLQNGTLNEETAKKALETIDRNVTAQAQLIEDLLDISRIVSGKMHFDFQPVKVWEVVSAGVDAIKPIAEAKNIQIQMIIDSNAGSVYGDFERLQQVIWNLLSNAVKFTPEDGQIDVKLKKIGSNVEITVSDTGQGIKREFLPQIFGRFTQADSSTTRGQGGMGLGLAIVKSIVEFHGGSVVVVSEGEGKGATFTVSLPVLQKKRKPTREIELERKGNHDYMSCPAELNGIKLLLVDDEIDTCEMITTAFKQCGTNVKFVTSAPEALMCLDEWTPDILIADISMPQMDGYELIRQVRKRESRAGKKSIPAIALTAMARVEDRIKAMTAGFQMHVAKPVEIDELRSITASLASVVVKES